MVQILLNNSYCGGTISLQYLDDDSRYRAIRGHYCKKIDYFDCCFLDTFCVSDSLPDLVINQLVSDSKIWIWRRILERTKSDKVASCNFCGNFYIESHCTLAWLFQQVASFRKKLSQKFYERTQFECFCSLVRFLEFDPHRISVTNSLLQL